jgi:hypothetical protein
MINGCAARKCRALRRPVNLMTSLGRVAIVEWDSVHGGWFHLRRTRSRPFRSPPQAGSQRVAPGSAAGGFVRA